MNVSEEKKNKTKNNNNRVIKVLILCPEFCWHNPLVHLLAQKKDIKDRITNKNLVLVICKEEIYTNSEKEVIGDFKIEMIMNLSAIIISSQLNRFINIIIINNKNKLPKINSGETPLFRPKLKVFLLQNYFNGGLAHRF